jgi:hypothetical protein
MRHRSTASGLHLVLSYKLLMRLPRPSSLETPTVTDSIQHRGRLSLTDDKVLNAC